MRPADITLYSIYSATALAVTLKLTGILGLSWWIVLTPAGVYSAYLAAVAAYILLAPGDIDNF